MPEFGMIKDIFMKSARQVRRWAFDEMLREYQDDIFQVDSATQVRKLNRTLDYAAAVAKLHPDLAVQWATQVALLSRMMRHRLADRAVMLATEHAEAAHRVAPLATREALNHCWLATKDVFLQHHVSEVLDRIEPRLKPGPWGLRQDGIDQVLQELRDSTTVWDRLGQLRCDLQNGAYDWYARVVHGEQPAPKITIE